VLEYHGVLTGEGGVSSLIDPATGRPLTQLPRASLAETDRAIEAAHAAFPAWKAVAPGDRARLLRRFAAVVEEHIDELAHLEVTNSGHTIGNATWEAGNVRDVLNYYSAAPEGSTSPSTSRSGWSA
jgi:betaine-aldehyde dehydrogenase